MALINLVNSHSSTTALLDSAALRNDKLCEATSASNDQVMMDIAMESSAQTWHSHDQQSLSPQPAPRDTGADDILLDTFFDHSQQLDSTTFDALLDTKFDISDDETSASTSASTQATKWRPARFEEQQQQHSPATSIMEPFNNSSGYAMVTGLPFSESQPHAYGAPVHATSSHDVLPARMYAPSPFEQQTMNHSLAMRPAGGLDHVAQHHYYPDPTTIANANHCSPEVSHHQQQQPSFHPPLSTIAQQDTADLLDYQNAIPEEDGPAANVNDEAADPCYAQLLYRCLLDAPDHTMALKDVYDWMRLHSQKARDSNTTGWQNSVRHNLSMNAAFERVTASSAHGPKKGSLWRLTNRALQEGVISTTRYRKDPKRKPERRSSPALKRQISGAKGGQATRAASAAKRALQARALESRNLSAIERHRRDVRRNDPTFFAPTSMPKYERAGTSSPQPYWVAHGLPHPPQPSPMFQHLSQPPSPHHLLGNEPWTMVGHQSLSNPNTPSEVQVGFGGPAKAMVSPPTNFNSPSRGFLTEFELQHLDHEVRGLFGNHDDFTPDTPSLATEGSFSPEEMTPMTADRMSVEAMSS